MDMALLAARLVLAAVFLVAGLTKLADGTGSRRALDEFGVPSALVAPGAWLLPLAELAVAVLLLPSMSAWWGAIGALALLGAFVVGIAALVERYLYGVGFRPLLDLIMVLVISGVSLFGFGFVGELVAGMREELRTLQREVDRLQRQRDGA